MSDHLDPQPPPTPGHGDVWLDVMRSVGRRGAFLMVVFDLVGGRVDLLADMCARRLQGIQRYGTLLQYDNGRDHWIDAFQESLDLVAYLHAARAPWWMRWASILFAALVRRRLTRETT